MEYLMEDFKNHNFSNDNDINLREILFALWHKKLFIFLVTSFASLASITYSINLPNIYKSNSVISPIDPSNKISANYSGLAAIAGINIPAQPESNYVKAIEKIQSLSFFELHILPNIFLPDLMAVDYWDSDNKLLVYDDKVYNKNKNIWIRPFSSPQKLVPSAQESFEKFKNDHLLVNENKQKGFVTISIRHQSPYVAEYWSSLIVDQINTFYKLKDKKEAEKSVDYLNNRIAITEFSEIKKAIAELLKQETQKLALIEANEYYVFDYIDPPVIMEKKSEPDRVLIVILGTFLGLILGIIFVFIKFVLYKN